MELKDEDIKKALECCADKDGASCKHCPYNSDCSKGGIRMLTDSLALINRQQVEIERLKGNLFTISNACMQRRNEAIKEFAAKLKCGVSITSGVITCADIDDLLAKMAGEQNA